jgi:hypothetical protein
MRASRRIDEPRFRPPPDRPVAIACVCRILESVNAKHQAFSPR